MLIKTSSVRITKVPARKGGNTVVWNVDHNGKPFGQIWTFKRKPGFSFCYHAKALSGDYAEFANLEGAEKFLRGLM